MINEVEERKSRKKNYGCEFRTKHRISQLLVEFYCTITHDKCKEKPSKCSIRLRTLMLEKHKPLLSYF
jgi:hypothetical protein